MWEDLVSAGRTEAGLSSQVWGGRDMRPALWYVLSSSSLISRPQSWLCLSRLGSFGRLQTPGPLGDLTSPQWVLYICSLKQVSWGSNSTDDHWPRPENIYYKFWICSSFLQIQLYPTPTPPPQGSKTRIWFIPTLGYSLVKNKGEIHRNEKVSEIRLHKLFWRQFSLFNNFQKDLGSNTHTQSGKWVNRKEKIDFYYLLV